VGIVAAVSRAYLGKKMLLGVVSHVKGFGDGEA